MARPISTVQLEIADFLAEVMDIPADQRGEWLTAFARCLAKGDSTHAYAMQRLEEAAQFRRDEADKRAARRQGHGGEVPAPDRGSPAQGADKSGHPAMSGNVHGQKRTVADIAGKSATVQDIAVHAIQSNLSPSVEKRIDDCVALYPPRIKNGEREDFFWTEERKKLRAMFEQDPEFPFEIVFERAQKTPPDRVKNPERFLRDFPDRKGFERIASAEFKTRANEFIRALGGKMPTEASAPVFHILYRFVLTFNKPEDVETFIQGLKERHSA